MSRIGEKKQNSKRFLFVVVLHVSETVQFFEMLHTPSAPAGFSQQVAGFEDWPRPLIHINKGLTAASPNISQKKNYRYLYNKLNQQTLSE